MLKKDVVIVTGAGIVIGVLEALIYYNMGKRREGEDFEYALPPAKEMAQTFGVVLVTSVLTGLLTQGIEKGVGMVSLQVARR